jgi:hypothetical protein
MSILAVHPMHEMVKGRERRFITQYRHVLRRGKASTSAYLQGSDMNFRFRGRIRVGERRTDKLNSPRQNVARLIILVPVL